jgi:hypothetical protein
VGNKVGLLLKNEREEGTEKTKRRRVHIPFLLLPLLLPVSREAARTRR